MRAALVIHGHFRNFQRLWPGWRDNLLAHQHYDVFVFAWGDSMGYNLPAVEDTVMHDGYDPSSPAVDANYISWVRDALQPRSLLLESCSDHEPRFRQMVDSYRGTSLIYAHMNHRPKSILAMVWSRCLAIKAKAAYEQQQGFVYDQVLVTRWDIEYPYGVDIHNADCSVMNCNGPPEAFPLDTSTQGPSHLMDAWAE